MALDSPVSVIPGAFLHEDLARMQPARDQIELVSPTQASDVFFG
jgi:hypothetical protein